MVHMLVVAVSSLVLAGPALAQPMTFRAGAATSNVTPRLGSSINGGMSDVIAAHVHDELHARCLVLDDGQARVAFVVVDSCMVPREVVQAAKAKIAERSGIAPDHVTISATHTHSAPASTPVFQSDANDDYVPFLVDRIADGVRRAVTNLAPAEIGWGSGAVPDEVFNRRWHLKPEVKLIDPFGKPEKVKMNPGAGGADLVGPAGPTDPELSVLAVRDKDGRPIAVLANYSLHYVGGVGPGHVSADYYGIFAERLRDELRVAAADPPFVAMMTNGTSGDINNINFREPRPNAPAYERCRAVAEKTAREAARVVRGMAFRSGADLDAKAVELTLKVRKPTEEEKVRAVEIVAKAKGPIMRGLEEVYARETLLIDKYPDTVPVTIQVVRVGELAITAIPCEVFVEIGLKLKAESPAGKTFTISLANGYNGYLPTKAHHELGGYETWRARSSYLEVDGAEKILRAALRLQKDVCAKPTR